MKINDNLFVLLTLSTALEHNNGSGGNDEDKKQLALHTHTHIHKHTDGTPVNKQSTGRHEGGTVLISAHLIIFHL